MAGDNTQLYGIGLSYCLDGKFGTMAEAWAQERVGPGRLFDRLTTAGPIDAIAHLDLPYNARYEHDILTSVRGHQVTEIWITVHRGCLGLKEAGYVFWDCSTDHEGYAVLFEHARAQIWRRWPELYVGLLRINDSVVEAGDALTMNQHRRLQLA